MAAATVEADEAGPLLPDLLARARGGETIRIFKDGEEIARLTPPIAAPEQSRLKRQSGWYKGELWIAPDIDEAWEEVLDAIEAKQIG